ncbi:macro domain-containing protein [Agrobacterium cavarae]|uniref:macro domain-containing protein n=1 Tax=Agrobacterium cavarae TaxID=2528239 RepID=UPI0028B1578A|nr:macro domain-containing protein [Agrobacterium cavarae]
MSLIASIQTLGEIEVIMLIYRRTSILESSAQTLVNTVNCVGVMGKGLAKAFKDRDAQMYSAYKRICDEGLLKPGKLWLWRGQPNWVLNFPTKLHWRNPSKIEWIEEGLEKFVAGHAELGIREISFPRLGCGNGGLNWDDVRPVMEHHLSPLKITVFIHDYDKSIGLPEHLERVPTILESEFGPDIQFANLLPVLKRALELAGDELINFETHERINASIQQDCLKVVEGATEWVFDTEDIWGIWVTLQKGFLTKDKAGWVALESGSHLISILSLLPSVRLVEIQKYRSKDSELALERRDIQNSSPQILVGQNEQTALQWR